MFKILPAREEYHKTFCDYCGSYLLLNVIENMRNLPLSQYTSVLLQINTYLLGKIGDTTSL